MDSESCDMVLTSGTFSIVFDFVAKLSELMGDVCEMIFGYESPKDTNSLVAIHKVALAWGNIYDHHALRFTPQ